MLVFGSCTYIRNQLLAEGMTECLVEVQGTVFCAHLAGIGVQMTKRFDTVEQAVSWLRGARDAASKKTFTAAMAAVDKVVSDQIKENKSFFSSQMDIRAMAVVVAP